MSSSTHADPPPGTLAAVVKHRTGASPMDCYQCGRCAAGCMQNVGGEMDVSPTRVMRLLQLEAAFSHDAAQKASFRKQAIASKTPWLCAGCQACTTRCPQGIDIAGSMDVLRQQGLTAQEAAADKEVTDIQALHQTFVQMAAKRGRIYEFGLVMLYKLKTGHFLQDAEFGPAMMSKGKLHLLPGKGADMGRVQKAASAIREELK